METVVEKRGRTVDEAVRLALEELDADIDCVDIDIVEEPAKGILGIGKRQALVRVTLREVPDRVVRKKLDELLAAMGLECRAGRITVEENTVKVNIEGKDVGLVIGRRGETLDALQFLLGLIVNRQLENKVRVVMDVEGYRAKREDSLKAMALRMSDKVKKTRKSIVMKPMSPQERRIIHTVLQNDPQIVTYSQGDEPNRKVVIALKKQ